MKKNYFLASGLVLGLSQAAFSGAMGPVSTSGLIPFVSAEGQIEAKLTYAMRNKDADIWGGRVAAGAMYPYNKLGFIAETGWNYFGSLKADITQSSANNGNAFQSDTSVHVGINGPDLLVGVSYRYKSFDFFLKAGTLFERVITKAKTNSLNATSPIPAGSTLPAINLQASGRAVSHFTEAVPEIKVGLAYALSQNWSILGSYMHAFGVDPNQYTNISIARSATLTQIQANWNIMNGVPSLDVFSLGLKYDFV